ncbi:hypothetical protein SASPL_101955 [Salvia splendens]|uniref:Uncharacterized protein n=1 Tax=Salvia splendens TaxID=180675 RepID=A0A8X8YQ94_SALSN|nr:hypothetical protein SASPL_101955 [Salvia splendens]
MKGTGKKRFGFSPTPEQKQVRKHTTISPIPEDVEPEVTSKRNLFNVLNGAAGGEDGGPITIAGAGGEVTPAEDLTGSSFEPQKWKDSLLEKESNVVVKSKMVLDLASSQPLLSTIPTELNSHPTTSEDVDMNQTKDLEASADFEKNFPPLIQGTTKTLAARFEGLAHNANVWNQQKYETGEGKPGRFTRYPTYGRQNEPRAGKMNHFEGGGVNGHDPGTSNAREEDKDLGKKKVHERLMIRPRREKKGKQGAIDESKLARTNSANQADLMVRNPDIARSRDRVYSATTETVTQRISAGDNQPGSKEGTLQIFEQSNPFQQLQHEEYGEEEDGVDQLMDEDPGGQQGALCQSEPGGYLAELTTAGKLGKAQWSGCDLCEQLDTTSWKEKPRKQIKQIKWNPPVGSNSTWMECGAMWAQGQEVHYETKKVILSADSKQRSWQAPGLMQFYKRSTLGQIWRWEEANKFGLKWGSRVSLKCSMRESMARLRCGINSQKLETRLGG